MTMKGNRFRQGIVLFTAIAWTVLSTPLTAFAAEEAQEAATGHWWALLPPIVAILLALITKEVYSALFTGILFGGVLWAVHFGEGNLFTATMSHVLEDGIIASLSDSYNMGIMVFLVVLGTMVALMNKTGGSAAFGEWANKKLKGRKGASLATILLGLIIAIDDYFICLTLGSVMRPVTDKNNVSRAKLAYLIDATAAPICIIAPISSWAAAVSGFVEGTDGFQMFLRTIPWNFYALLTITMTITISILGINYGPMRKHENNAILHDDLFTTSDRPYANAAEESVVGKGKVIDLVFPVVSLLVCCPLGMYYSGVRETGSTNIIEAFSNSDASVGLVFGSVIALIVAIVFFLVRRTLSFDACMGCLPDGFKSMVPAMLILTFAWTLKAMSDSLFLKEFVAYAMRNSASGLMNMLPAIIFLVAVGLSFASGTSWGTFGILIPIVVALFNGVDDQLMIIGMAACMAGAVCGDHCSPISDTTIMSSAGAQCNHINHVQTQLPYAMTCAAVCFVIYVLAGFTRSVLVLPAGMAVIIALMLAIRRIVGRDPEVPSIS